MIAPKIVKDPCHYTSLLKNPKEGIGSSQQTELFPRVPRAVMIMVLTLSLLFGVLSTSGHTEQQITEKEKSLLKKEYQLHADCNLALAQAPDSYQALWQAAYSNLRLGWLTGEKEIRKAHYLKALNQAHSAYALQPETYDSHLILGIAQAKTIGYISRIKQVGIAREIGEHARFLLSKRTDDPDLWYIFSWWNFKLSRVKKVDRMFALILGGLPKGTSLKKAYDAIDRAISLRPTYAAYLYDAGLFYERTGHSQKAEDFYKRVFSLQPTTPEDFMFIRRAGKKIQSLQKAG